MKLKLLQLLTNELLVLRIARVSFSKGIVSHLLGTGVLVGLAAHLHAKTRFSTLKVLVVVSSSLGSASDTSKAPSVELASKGRVLGVLEILGEDIRGELFLLVNDKALSVGKPGDDVIGLFVRDNLHEL